MRQLFVLNKLLLFNNSLVKSVYSFTSRKSYYKTIGKIRYGKIKAIPANIHRDEPLLCTYSNRKINLHPVFYRKSESEKILIDIRFLRAVGRFSYKPNIASSLISNDS